MTLVQPFAVFADVMTSSNATASNANVFAPRKELLLASASDADSYSIATMELTDEDYGIAPASSVGTVSNTIYSSTLPVEMQYINLSTENYTYMNATAVLTDGRYKVFGSAPSGCVFTKISFVLNKRDMPSPGYYDLSFDFASDFSLTYNNVFAYYLKEYVNTNAESSSWNIGYIQSSGDIYVSPFKIDLNSPSNFRIVCNLKIAENITVFGGEYAFSFIRSDSSGSATQIGSASSGTDIDYDMSNSLADMSDSFTEMSDSLDSVANSLEYVSTSQNLIIQGIDNVIMHISDQLYAFWDQLYNLIHEPTYARLGDILDSLGEVASGVPEAIEDSNQALIASDQKLSQDQIKADKENTEAVTGAVEKHGNFIIEGLKGLFIPSDDFFKSYFDDLYDFFSEAFGFLSFPIDLLVRLIDLFANSSDRDCILTLPSFEISGEQLISEASFNLTEFLENDFSLVLSSIRMVTSIGLIMAFVSLCQTKWNEVMRN